jgi:hypothetical protein
MKHSYVLMAGAASCRASSDRGRVARAAYLQWRLGRLSAVALVMVSVAASDNKLSVCVVLERRVEVACLHGPRKCARNAKVKDCLKE